MNVVFTDMRAQIFQECQILLRELRAVVCQEIVELERNEFMHAFGYGFGVFIVDNVGPCRARVIILHRKDWNAVELR